MNLDSNLGTNETQGSATLTLSSLINVIPTLMSDSFSEDGTLQLLFKNRALNLTQFVIPPVNFSQLFDSNRYNSNFFQAFGQDFPTKIDHQFLFGLQITITNDLPFSRLSYLSKNEEAAFRFLNCMVFGLIFSLKLKCCYCYPQNLAEYAAVRAGIGLNCVNVDCKNAIKLNPFLYDDLVHSNDCNDLNIQAAFVSLSIFSAGKATATVNIEQTARELDAIADPLKLLPVGTILSLPYTTSLPAEGFLHCNGKLSPPTSLKIGKLPDFRFLESKIGMKFFIKVY